MWQTNTHWFDVAVVTTVLMLGHLSFGCFVEYQSRGHRLLKSLLGVAILVGTSAWAGRTWMYVLIGVMGVGVLIVHGWWLPRKGVNGWTAEPRERYFEIMGLDRDGRKPINRRDSPKA